MYSKKLEDLYMDSANCVWHLFSYKTIVIQLQNSNVSFHSLNMQYVGNLVLKITTCLCFISLQLSCFLMCQTIWMNRPNRNYMQ